MAKQTRFHWARRASPISQHCGMNRFREDFDIDWLDKLAELGCLDAPEILPAGSTYRFLDIDTIAERIDAWPATSKAMRSAQQ